MKVFDIAITSLRRFLRDRSNLFFVFIFPLLLVLAIGLVFGGSGAPRVGVIADGADPLAAELVAELEANDAMQIDRYDSRSDLETAVERQTLSAGLIIPEGYGEQVSAGRPVEIEYLAQPNSVGSGVQVAIEAVVADQAIQLRAASALTNAASFDEALARVRSVAVPGVEVITSSVATDGPDFSDFGQFGFGAAQQLALFVWLTSLTTSAYLIENRQLGVVRRMAATPTSPGQIVTGELLGRYGIALVQALLIVVVSALAFDVRWGDPLAVAALVMAYCLVGTGAGMLLGAVLRNEQQSSAVGLGLGLGMAALGGSMVPLEIFSDGMKQLAHTVTPHAWLIDGFTELVARGGGLADVATELAVLAGAGVVLVSLATVAFRRAVTTVG